MGDVRATLRKIASRCRVVLEETPLPDRDVRLRGFPRGACDVADLVGRVVFETTGQLGLYACGQQHPSLDPQQSHAWLEVDGLIIDVTYDQFPSTGLAGWVFDNSPWHGQFHDIELRALCLDPRDWAEYPHRTYALLRHAVVG